MSRPLINIFGYAVLILMGMYFVARHKRLGSRAQQFQREKFHIHVNEKWQQVCYLVGGIFFVVFSLIELLKLLKK